MSQTVAYNMDCMEAMRTFPDKFFDLAVVDPPYGISASEMQMGKGSKAWNKGKCWDDEIPQKKYFTDLFRVSNFCIIFGGNYFHLGSGSSRIAAYDAGLDFWGYEIDKEYFEKQEERFAIHTSQVSMFE